MVVNRDIREQAGVDRGDEVKIEMQIDTEPRTVVVPRALQEALSANPEARAFFDGLSYSHKKEYAQWIESSKKEETRQRRTDKAVDLLTQGKRLKLIIQ